MLPKQAVSSLVLGMRLLSPVLRRSLLGPRVARVIIPSTINKASPPLLRCKPGTCVYIVHIVHAKTLLFFFLACSIETDENKRGTYTYLFPPPNLFSSSCYYSTRRRKWISPNDPTRIASPLTLSSLSLPSSPTPKEEEQDILPHSLIAFCVCVYAKSPATACLFNQP